LKKELKRHLDLIFRGAAEIISEAELAQRISESLESGRPLRVKAGFDPTAPDLHLGHTVLIHKLRHFQELGHQVIFLIGDFTGLIGDPSGQTEARKPMTREELMDNAATYRRQIFKILDSEKTEVSFNSAWLSKLSLEEVIRLTGKLTVARMLERDDFESRYRQEKPIGLHEFLYPLLQGYDSVALQADVELGGTDQKFNLLMGREIQRDYGQKPQIVLTMPILEGVDGLQKMSKSYGNYIGIDEPPGEIFGKVMSISDELMWRYFELLSSLSMEEIGSLKEKTDRGEASPMEAKKTLALEMTALYHSREEAEAARAGFEKTIQKGGLPDRLPEAELEMEGESMWLPLILKSTGLAGSTSEARRLMTQGGIKLLDEEGRLVRVLKDVEERLPPGEYIFRRGSRRHLKVSLSEKNNS
jgi:tyrosyl-tRNA synthetase